MALQRAVSGARAKVLINNQEVGWATGVDITETIDQLPVEVLGEIDVVEHEPNRRTVTVSVRAIRILKKSAQAMGIWPRGETADVINFPPMDLMVYDVVGNAPIDRVTGVKANSRQLSLDRAGLYATNATFVARRIYDEQES
ncbi:MAG: hypothetical protein AMXMBFR64_45690 [Myxococcales bacterium]